MLSEDDFLVARYYLNTVCPKQDTTSIIQNNITIGQYDLTVIIPCYNEERYIDQCVQSVLEQKGKYKIKIVIINDGSTDNTTRILKKYEGLPHIAVIHQENHGFSGARNRGLREIESKYVFFLDADDYLLDDTLEAMLDVAIRNEADVLEAQVINLVEGQLIREKLFESTKAVETYKLSGYAWGKIINAELFCNVCFPEQYWYEDTIMPYLIYPRCRKVMRYNRDVYVYRRNREGFTKKSQGETKSVDTYWITELMLSDMKKIGIKIDQAIYELLLNQIALNYIRTGSQEINVKVAIYTLTIEWFQGLQLKYNSAFEAQTVLERALCIQNYPLYEQGCLILWNRML